MIELTPYRDQHTAARKRVSSRKPRQLLLDHPQGDRDTVSLPDLAPVGVGGEAVVTDHDLALAGDVGRQPGDEFMAVDVESRVPPGENPPCPLRAEKPFPDQEPEDLPVEDPGSVDASLGHQE